MSCDQPITGGQHAPVQGVNMLRNRGVSMRRCIQLVMWNSVVVDTLFDDARLDCNVWRVSESKEEQYDEYYEWYHKNHGDLPKNKWLRLVDVVTCNDNIVYELRLFREKH